MTDLIKESEKRLSSKLETLVSDIKELVKKPVDQQTKKDKEDITDQIDEVKKIADEYGLDPEPLQKLADVILAKVKLPKDITEKLESLEEIKKERDQDDFWKKQETKFDSEFGELKDSEAFAEEFQKLSPAEIVTVKEKLNELAFTKRYSGYSLVDLLTLKQDELLIEKKKSATPGRGGSQRAGGGVDLSGKTELTADQINDLSDEEFDTYSANMKKEHKSPLKRRGNPVP